MMNRTVSLITAVALAAFAAPAFAELEEIIVTAQKRSENLQDVPIAVSAISDDALRSAGVGKVEELALVVPGFSLTRQGASTQLYIRGVGSTGGAAGQESAVATFIDGVYMPAQIGANFAFSNLERIEVLKGPQGTLYGRNATGGAMNIVTRTPSHTTSVQAEAGYGNKNTLLGNFYLTGGVTDSIAADVSAFYNKQEDGFGKNLATGNDVGYSRDVGLRSKVLIDAGEGTRITLAGDYGQSRGTVGTAYRNYGPGSLQIFSGINGWPFGYWDVDNDLDPYYQVTIAGASGRVEHDFGGASFTSITAYRTSKSRQRFDIDETSLPLFSATTPEHDKQFTQEFQLAGNQDSLNWIVGAFFLDGSAAYTPWRIFGALFAPAGFSDEIVTAKQDTKSYALFGQTTFALTERDNLTVGARYSMDKRHLTGSGVLVLLDGTQIPAVPDQDRSKTFKKPTWRLSLDHQMSDDVMLYGSYNRGFQSGVYNLGGNVVTSPAVNPETLDAFEVGAKTTLFDKRLRFNTAAFYYKYKNLQLARIQDGTQVIVNAARAEMYGLDVDFDAALTEQFSLRGGGEWLHGEYTKFPGAPFTTANPNFPFGNVLTGGDAKGNKLSRSPDYSATITADFHFPLAGGVLSNAATYAYNNGFYWEPDNDLKQKAYGLLSGEVRWTAPSGGYYVRGFGKNLTNKKYAAMGVTSELGDIGSVAPGRTYGLAVGVNF